LRKYLRELFLNFLGALTKAVNLVAAALRAGRGNALLIIAVVAMQVRRQLVQGQARITAAAFGHPAAITAGNQRGETAPVNKYQYLLIILQMLVHGTQHRLGKAGN